MAVLPDERLLFRLVQRTPQLRFLVLDLESRFSRSSLAMSSCCRLGNRPNGLDVAIDVCHGVAS